MGRQIPLSAIGPYEIGDEIGNGAFSCIFAGKSRATKEQVALKVMQRSNFVNRGIGHQLENELLFTSSCAHPHIIELLQVIQEQDNVVMVFPRATTCLQRHLAKMSRANSIFAESEVRRLSRQLFGAVAYINNSGVIHRDLKPENILIYGLNLKVADFGWAILESDRPQTLAGTFLYMAPEVLRNEVQTCRLDAWGIGMILYHLLMNVSFLPYDLQREFSDKQNPMQAHDICQRLLVEIESRVPLKSDKRPRENENGHEVSLISWNLLRKLIVSEPENRFSAQKALEHPWLKNGEEEEERDNSRGVSQVSRDQDVGEGNSVTSRYGNSRCGTSQDAVSCAASRVGISVGNNDDAGKNDEAEQNRKFYLEKKRKKVTTTRCQKFSNNSCDVINPKLSFYNPLRIANGQKNGRVIHDGGLSIKLHVPKCEVAKIPYVKKKKRHANAYSPPVLQMKSKSRSVNFDALDGRVIGSGSPAVTSSTAVTSSPSNIAGVEMRIDRPEVLLRNRPQLMGKCDMRDGGREKGGCAICEEGTNMRAKLSSSSSNPFCPISKQCARGSDVELSSVKRSVTRTMLKSPLIAGKSNFVSPILPLRGLAANAMTNRSSSLFCRLSSASPRDNLSRTIRHFSSVSPTRFLFSSPDLKSRPNIQQHCNQNDSNGCGLVNIPFVGRRNDVSPKRFADPLNATLSRSNRGSAFLVNSSPSVKLRSMNPPGANFLNGSATTIGNGLGSNIRATINTPNINPLSTTPPVVFRSSQTFSTRSNAVKRMASPPVGGNFCRVDQSIGRVAKSAIQHAPKTDGIINVASQISKRTNARNILSPRSTILQQQKHVVNDPSVANPTSTSRLYLSKSRSQNANETRYATPLKRTGNERLSRSPILKGNFADVTSNVASKCVGLGLLNDGVFVGSQGVAIPRSKTVGVPRRNILMEVPAKFPRQFPSSQLSSNVDTKIQSHTVVPQIHPAPQLISQKHHIVRTNMNNNFDVHRISACAWNGMGDLSASMKAINTWSRSTPGNVMKFRKDLQQMKSPYFEWRS